MTLRMEHAAIEMKMICFATDRSTIRLKIFNWMKAFQIFLMLKCWGILDNSPVQKLKTSPWMTAPREHNTNGENAYNVDMKENMAATMRPSPNVSSLRNGMLISKHRRNTFVLFPNRKFKDVMIAAANSKGTIPTENSPVKSRPFRTILKFSRINNDF